VDWKAYYRREVEDPESRTRILSWLTSNPDSKMDAAFARGAVVSFPHTALDNAGPLQGRVVSALYRRGVERIVALGVLHSSGVEALRRALDERRSGEEREMAFAAVSGAFAVPCAEFDTPFGAHPLWRPVEEPDVFRVDPVGLLAEEFSLDTFVSILRLGADVLKRRPIPALPVYVGMTRHPITGDFSLAGRLAKWLKRCTDRATAVVTTGDLVHYGTAYGGSSDGPPGGAPDGALERRFRAELTRTLDAALTGGDQRAAYQRSQRVLRSDQRELLPLIASYLGAPSSYDVVHFQLSDYAQILAVSPPCLVASALVIYG
jgi:hypothetical protein